MTDGSRAAERKKIAILGGGMGALATAYELTRTPELRARHDVTIYQMGWRLGGKLASGRTPGAWQRNEEHGLHVWLGFYENAFMMLRGVYDQLVPDRGEAFQAWTDAMRGQSFTPLGERYGDDWTTWAVTWPENADIPGSGSVLLTPWGAVTELVSAVERFVEMLRRHPAAPLTTKAAVTQHALGDEVRELLSEALAVEEVAAEAAAVEMLSLAVRWVHAFEGNHEKFSAEHHGGLSSLLERFLVALSQALDGGKEHPAIRGLFHVSVLGVAITRALLDPRSGFLLTADLSALDRFELRELLKRHSAFGWVIDNADELRAFYDLAFAYENGEIERPNVGAGAAIRCILRIVATSKGYVLYLPQAGFGEAVIAPIHRVLRQNGVRFRFFHRVTRLELDRTRNGIARVHFAEQARALGGEYRPTAYLPPSEGHGGVWYWPSEPFWEQLEGGDELRRAGVNFESKWRQPERTRPVVVERGVDFDEVVLAIAPPAFMQLDGEPTLADELFRERPAFRAAIHALGVVPTLSVQLWMRQDLAGLGWRDPKPAMVAAPELLDVWADMTQVLPFERFVGADLPRSVHYFCCIYPTRLYARPASDRTVPDRAEAEVHRIAREWFDLHTGLLWPRATRADRPSALDDAALSAPDGLKGEARFAAQFFRANVDPTECCVASLAGTTAARLGPRGAGFENLVLAGDWTRSVTNTACVESAVSSGKAAARAICGEPRVIPGEDFFFGLGRRGEKEGDVEATRRDSRAGLPKYVSFHGSAEQSAMPPGKVQNGRCYYFAFPCDPARAQAFVDAKLNAPSAGAVRYHVLGTSVLVSMLAADKLFSTGEVTGYLQDRECGVWLPLVVDQRDAKPRFRLVLWMPYVLIDNCSGMATGREVWGFRKEMSSLVIPQDPWDATTFVASATIFREFAPESFGRDEPLVTIRRTKKLGLARGTWVETSHAFEAIVRGIAGEAGQLGVHGLEEEGEILLDVAELVSARNVPIVNLKQFRDAEDPTLACYQALVESPIHLDALHGGWGLDGEYELDVTPCESHQIARDLGLAPQRVPATFAFWIDFDFSALAGKVVWKA